MSRPSARTTAALRLGIFLMAAGLAGVSCGDIGDASYAPPSTLALNQVDLDNKPFCVGTCKPDYGSQRINCDAEAGLEFFPVPVLDAGRPAAAGGLPPTISQFYAYNDGTADFMWAGPARFNGTAIVTNDPASTGVSNYEPTAVVVNDRCGPDGMPAPKYVHHLRGGLFTEWGGGMGRRLLNFASSASTACSIPPAATDPAHCPDADPRIESVADRNGNGGLRTNAYGMMADLSAWEGISFWARQGPDNTAGIRVYVGDRQLDEDIAFLETNAGLEPMCGRKRECGCRNHRPCTKNDAPVRGYSCWDPAIEPSPASLLAANPPGNIFINPYDICGSSLCDVENQAFGIPDPLFATPDNTDTPGSAQCQLYKLTNDLETYYCYDANKSLSYPPNGPQECGDGWAKGIQLSTDWQFYTIPFSDLRQEGWGKEFAYLDRSKITLVRFTWMQGWVDVWLDDVRFYRHPSSAQQTP